MKITELCDLLDVELDIKYYPNQNNRWSAKFYGGELLQGGCLVSAFSNGATPNDAISNYVRRIQGTRMVFNAYGDNRKEFVIPKTLEA